MEEFIQPITEAVKLLDTLLLGDSKVFIALVSILVNIAQFLIICQKNRKLEDCSKEIDRRQDEETERLRQELEQVRTERQAFEQFARMAEMFRGTIAERLPPLQIEQPKRPER